MIAPARRLLYVVNDRASFVARRLAIAVAAAEAGYDVHAILPDRMPSEGGGHFSDMDAEAVEAELATAPVTVHPVPLSRRGTQLSAEARTVAAISRVLARVQPDVVHQFTLKPILYGTLAAVRQRPSALVNSFVGLGYMLEAAGPVAALRRQLLLRGYGAMARWTRAWSVFQNPENAAAVGAAAQLDPRRVKLIRGSGVDLDRFPATPAPTGELPLVVLPARMLADKGLGEFVEAARRVRQSGVAGRFALVGGTDPGNPAAVPESTLRAWADSGDIEWWGHRRDMSAVFQAAAVVCLPSYAEGVPRALLEAAASGRAIVTSNVPGCREVVQQGHNGLLVPPRDAGALADALAVILKDGARRAAMGAAGRELVVREFSLPAVIRQTVDLYDVALAASGRQPPLLHRADPT